MTKRTVAGRGSASAPQSIRDACLYCIESKNLLRQCRITSLTSCALLQAGCEALIASTFLDIDEVIAQYTPMDSLTVYHHTALYCLCTYGFVVHHRLEVSALLFNQIQVLLAVVVWVSCALNSDDTHTHTHTHTHTPELIVYVFLLIETLVGLVAVCLECPNLSCQLRHKRLFVAYVCMSHVVVGYNGS